MTGRNAAAAAVPSFIASSTDVVCAPRERAAGVRPAGHTLCPAVAALTPRRGVCDVEPCTAATLTPRPGVCDVEPCTAATALTPRRGVRVVEPCSPLILSHSAVTSLDHSERLRDTVTFTTSFVFMECAAWVWFMPPRTASSSNRPCKRGDGPAVLPAPGVRGGGPAVLPAPGVSGGGPAVLPAPRERGGGPAVLPAPCERGAGPAVLPAPGERGGAPAVLPAPCVRGGGPAVVFSVCLMKLLELSSEDFAV